ncbi:MAG: AlpA family transcriptional regulator [Pseudomonadota bacterium]
MQDKDERLLSRRKVEERFGISKRFLEVAAVRGDGPCMIKIGRLARYRARDVRDWIEASCVSISVSHTNGKAGR